MKVTTWLAALAALILAGGCVAPTATTQPVQTAPAPAAAAQPTLKEALIAVAPPEAAKTVATVEAVANTPVPKAPEAPAAVTTAPTLPTKAAVTEAVKTEAATATKSTLAKVAPAVPVPPLRPVIYQATNGQVTFDHKKHAAKSPCGSCHLTKPIAKIAIDKDKAHQMCKGCHQQTGVGPTSCTGCHKK